MSSRIEILKGLHPGIYVKRELTDRCIKSGQFALSIGEHPQTMSAIIRGRRSMNTALSLRIEQALGLEEGLLMTMQVFFDIAEEKRRLSSLNRPDLSKFRPTLFWDTTLEKIDFTAHRRYVINRVFERGNDAEISEIIRYYGRKTVLENIVIDPQSPFRTAILINLKKHFNYGS